MDEDGFTSLSGARVAIVGLGLMGGSLALALRGRCAGLLGIDPDPGTRELAREGRVVDELSAELDDRLAQADLIVLAAPVGAILRLLGELPQHHPGSPVVLDLGSTKAEIVAAMGALPERFDPIGGHPMCGKEKGSLRHADPRLYQGAAFALTPLERSGRQARRLAEELVLAVGARPLWIDPATHDRWVAATSHAPYLLANALAAATPLEAAALVGPGLRSTTRLAATPPGMIGAVLATNREEILAALARFRGRLELLEACLERSDFAGLQELLAHGAAQYQELTSAGISS